MKRTAWAILMAAVAVPLWAQNIEDGDDPDHGVARLSLLTGDVTVQRGDTGEAVAGELNAPLVALDHVLTGAGARAEVQFDYANMIRMGALSEVRIVELKDNDYYIQVAEGTTTFRVLRDTNTRIEISTPTVSVRPTEKGVYRITVRPDGATEITVRNGQAEIYTPSGMEVLRSGKTMEARGTAANPEFMIVSARSKDDWDRWNEDRDRDLERSQSYKYVGRDVAGADDLDNHGRWVYDSPYGWVWVPNVTTSWAPYRVGRWSYVNYYGWTWLSGDPWGWAPYHYGRWYSSSYGWAWYPGATLGYRTYWRPALVGFFGWGNSNVNFGIGFGFGNVGWVPLAPYEIYNPWYGPRYRGGINRTNITVVNNTNIVNVYRNARQFNGRNGVTSVQSGNFGRGRVNNDNYVRVTNNDLTRAGRVQGAVPFDQDRDSRRFSDRTPAPDAAARVGNNRNTQFATSEVRSRRAGGTATAVAPSSGNPGNTRVGADRGTVDRATGGNPRSSASAPAQSDGWRRFDPGAGANGAVDRTGVTRGTDTRATDNTRRSAGSSEATVNDSNNRTRRATEMAPRVEQGSPASADNGSRSRARVGETQPSAPVRDAPVDNNNRTRRSTEMAPRQPSSPVQINPSIVRERGNSSAPSVNTRRAEPSPQQSFPSNNGGGTIRSNRGDGGNGGVRSAPAPSAPPSGGGGGGGTIRSGGGGGGGGNQRGASPAPSGNGGGNSGGGGDRGRRR